MGLDTGTLDLSVEILSSLANIDSLKIFLACHEGIESSTRTIEEIGLTQKRYYTWLKRLIDAGLVEPMNNLRRGIRLTDTMQADTDQAGRLPLKGYIAAGRPLEAMDRDEQVEVPAALRTDRPCYVLEVRGDSMLDEGILDGDWVVIESRNQARNGEIVVALVDSSEVTLKRIEQKRGEVVLHPANRTHKSQHFRPERIQIQGVLVGQMRRYH